MNELVRARQEPQVIFLLVVCLHLFHIFDFVWAVNPVVYNRLRHDEKYLQIYRAYQLKQPYEEKQITVRFNQTGDDNKIKEVSYSYYENHEIDASSIILDDLILEALDRTYKSRLRPVYIYNYDNPKEKQLASDPSLISPTRCQRELDYLVEKLDFIESARMGKYNPSISPELAAFFDSYASEEPGLLFGNYHWTGNWRQCSKRLVFDLDRTRPSNTISFSGRYCIASIRSKSWASKIKRKTAELLNNYFKYPEQRYDYARFFRIQLGLCLPESCDSRTVDSNGETIRRLAVHKLSEPLRSYELADLYCLPDETSELRRLDFGAWLFILAALAWCSIVLGATMYDTAHPVEKERKDLRKSVADKLVSAMSLRRNWHRLTETDSLRPRPIRVDTQLDSEPRNSKQCTDGGQKPRASDLLFLNAFKAISMPAIIYGHTGMFGEQLDRFPLDYESLGTGFMFHFHASSVFFVDWYFVMTGFITTYIMFSSKRVESYSLLQWAYTIFHRYWRLAPLYVLLFWFSRHVFQFTGSGPVWDYGTSNMTLRHLCHRESWISPLTLTSNLHPLHDECIMPTWYISNDMQFYLITPLILVALSRWPLGGWLMTLGLILSSILLRAHKYLTDPRAQPLELMRPRYDLYMRNNWDLHQTYVSPQFRVSSYLVGVLAGHYAFMVLSGQWRSFVRPEESAKLRHSSKRGGGWSSIFRTMSWFLGLQLVLSFTLSTWTISELFPRSLEPQVKYFTAFVYAIDHTAAAFGLAIMFVTFLFGQFPSLKRFLSHPLWSLVTRVNFFVFLIQVELIMWIWQSSERVGDFSPVEAIKIWIMVTCLCYALAALVTLWVEYPLAQLEREFIGSIMEPARPLPQPTTAAATTTTTAPVRQGSSCGQELPARSGECDQLVSSELQNRHPRAMGQN